LHMIFMYKMKNSESHKDRKRMFQIPE